jgi:hypothetical protein
MKQFSSSLMTLFMSFTAVTATGCVRSAESSDVPAEDTKTVSAALSDCQINPDGTASCARTAIVPVSNRNVHYRIGANTGPGYDPATGRHAAVFLFQGTSPDGKGSEQGTGGSNGPAVTWNASFTKPGSFGVWHQVATVVALVNAGYTVIQAAARYQCLIGSSTGCGYFWDSNIGFRWSNPFLGRDKALVEALIQRIQPGNTTFGAIDIHHVYAMGISSGGYMCSRMANEYAGGINGNSTVKDTSKPFRAVAIQSASYQNCGLTCDPPDALPSDHPPTFFLHDPADPIVPFQTMQDYLDELNRQFPNGNPVYTVNSVQEEFTLLDEFSGDAGPDPGHQWSSELTGDASNTILQWFNSHR